MKAVFLMADFKLLAQIKGLEIISITKKRVILDVSKNFGIAESVKVYVTNRGEKPIEVIKAVRSETFLDLKGSKDVVDGLNPTSSMPVEKAMKLIKAVSEAGGIAVMK